MKQDFIVECNTERLPFKEFMLVWCQKCRNSACRNAGWGTSKWVARMATQEDRLLDNPIFADPEDPNFTYVREVDFPDLLKQAIRLEIATRNNDWEIPSQDSVEQQVEKNNNQGLHFEKETGKPSIVSREQEEEEDGIPTAHPDSSDNPTQQQTATNLPLPSDLSLAKPRRFMSNTPFPSEGVMLDGGSPPPEEDSSPSEDPWAPKPSERKVNVGATIDLGSNKS